MDLSYFGLMNVVDLTQPFSSAVPVYPGEPPVSLTQGAPAGEGDLASISSWLLSCSDHSGTHLDVPRHFFEKGLSVDRLPVADLLAPGIVIDVRETCAEDDDHRIGLAAVEGWEKQHGYITAGSMVLFLTGWSFRWSDPARYLPRDEGGTLHTPGLGADVAEFLTRERLVRGVGIDAPSIDVGRSTSYPAHRALLGAGVYLLENLTNLYQLPEQGFLVITAPLRLVGAGGSPCRVLALAPRR